MNYFMLKHFHQVAVLLSVLGFAVRAIAALGGAAWVRARWARTLPHVLDTLLLLSGIGLLALLRLSPHEAPWLAAKLVGLVAYIGLGIIAMRPGLPRSLRLASAVLAIVTAVWMVSVALSKSPLGFLGAL